MKPSGKTNPLLRAPKLTLARIIFALAVAVLADGLQMVFSMAGWVIVDQAIDLVAMILVSWFIGFHLLLLPTFAVEFIPVIDMLPTWTGCTVAVIALRKRGQNSPPPANMPDKPTIDV